MATNQEIQQWLSANPSANDQQIAQAMQQYGVTPVQMSDATGLDFGSVLNRYNAATGGTGVSDADINYYLNANPGQADFYTRQAMDKYGVGVDQMARATGLDAGAVQSRYDAAAPVPMKPGGDDFGGGYGGGYGGGAGAFGSYGGFGGFGNQSNPWMQSTANDIMRRTNDALGQSFNGIRSNAVGVGGLGGSRQGVAEGLATRGAMDSMQGNLASLFGQDWNNTQNRGLQQYNTDTSAYLGNQGQWLNYGLGLGGLQNQRYGMDQNFALGVGGLANQQRGQDQNFYSNERRTDLAGVGLGADLYSRGIGGEWAPIQNATAAYSPFNGFGTSTTSGQQGGGAMGALGGAMTGWSLGQQITNPNYSYGGNSNWRNMPGWTSPFGGVNN